jgi:hypothetical protein
MTNAPAPAAPAPTSKSAKEPQPPAVETKRILLTEVLFDPEWNVRSKDDTDRVVPEGGAMAGYDPEIESTGLGGGGEKTEPGLIEMIREQGQLDPAEVRPNPDPATKSRFPYRGIAGHRRHTALTKIAEKALKDGDPAPIKKDPSWDPQKPTIWVVVKSVNEFEARERNLNEGTSHSPLSTPDLAYGIEQLRLAAKEAGKGEITGAEIAKRIGKSEAYVSQIMKVNRLPKKILAHWRKGGKATFAGKDVVATYPQGLTQMYELTQHPHDDLEKEYVKLLENKPAKGNKNMSPEEKKFDTARKKAASIGKLLGWLAYTDIAQFKGKDGDALPVNDWRKIVFEQVAFTRLSGKDPTEKQVDLLVETAKEAFKFEQNRLANPEDMDEEDSEEVKQKKRDKRDGGR